MKKPFEPNFNTPLENFSKEDSRTFTPPTSGKGNDWVLVIDDSQKEFGKPGKL